MSLKQSCWRARNYRFIFETNHNEVPNCIGLTETKNCEIDNNGMIWLEKQKKIELLTS